MINRSIALFVLASFVAVAAPVLADAPATPVPSPNAAEAQFVAAIAVDLTKRFPTTAAAEKAGYKRYTNEDDTGAISYANLQWSSADPKHPSQLWYDAKGRLIGADFSVLQSASPSAPSLWGVDPSRWQKFGDHVHFVLKNADGTLNYDHAIGAKKYAAAGGDPAHPTADGLVKAGAVKSAGDVAWVFDFPAIWDMIVWVIPNPSGAFADKNPNVTPSAKTKSSM
jgi:hypothetical protein